MDRQERLADFDQLWEFVRDHGCFAPDAATWERVRLEERPRAETAPNDEAYVRVLERVLDALHDPHTHLRVQLPGSPRYPGSDVWAEWRGNRAVIVDVRSGSAVAQAGIRPGDEVLAIGERSIAEAVAERRPRFEKSTPEIEEWTLLAVLAGRVDEPRKWRLRRSNGSTAETIIAAKGSRSEDKVSWRMLPEKLGYIRVPRFSGADVAAAFDDALQGLRDSRGLIVDLRDNGGGDTGVARPMMGRFVEKRSQYAWMTRRRGTGFKDRWAEYVEPKGPFTYEAPVAVVVNRFTVSMAEGFAMGMNGIAGATIVGTRMAGLGAGVWEVVLTYSQLTAQVSAEPVYHVNGTPRWQLKPGREVDLAASKSADPALDAAVAELTPTR